MTQHESLAKSAESRSILVRFVIFPALVCLFLTLVRVWLEVNDPTYAYLVSVFALTLALVFALALRLASRFGFKAYAWRMLLLVAAIRLPIAAVYALAWEGKWTVAGTTQWVRYVVQLHEQGLKLPLDTSGLFVFAFVFPFTTLVFFAAGIVAWFVAKPIKARLCSPSA